MEQERRDELIAQMLAEYREELAALTDVELLSHWHAARYVRDMTPQEWADTVRA